MHGRIGLPRRAKVERLDAFRYESLAVLILLCVVMTLLSPYFLSLNNFLNILLATAVIGILAIGATFVISSAAIDLSVGSLLAVSAVVAASSSRTRASPGRLASLQRLRPRATGAD
jgi:ribose/xylose/arabinose/galactoside ABC-type transport system permease subunit